jgi:5-methylcytosine-specific restriction endonuclease McrA
MTTENIHNEIFIPFSSRLQNLDSLDFFTQIFAYHGVFGRREIIDQTRTTSYSEFERLKVTPLVFGLMPLQALSRDSISVPIRGAIATHLRCLGINDDPSIVSIIKEISDQFYQAKSSKIYRKSKYSISRVIQAHGQVYREMQLTQNNRCAICGLNFTATNNNKNAQQTLDHCIPWNLIGDPSDGSNWQILCQQCNNAKSHYLSNFQFSEILNWVYTDKMENLAEAQPSTQTRYIVLSQKNACEYPNCTKNRHNSELFVFVDQNAIAVVDHCKVYCQEHYQQLRSPRNLLN